MGSLAGLQTLNISSTERFSFSPEDPQTTACGFAGVLALKVVACAAASQQTMRRKWCWVGLLLLGQKVVSASCLHDNGGRDTVVLDINTTHSPFTTSDGGEAGLMYDAGPSVGDGKSLPIAKNHPKTSPKIF